MGDDHRWPRVVCLTQTPRNCKSPSYEYCAHPYLSHYFGVSIILNEWPRSDWVHWILRTCKSHESGIVKVPIRPFQPVLSSAFCSHTTPPTPQSWRIWQQKCNFWEGIITVWINDNQLWLDDLFWGSYSFFGINYYFDWESILGFTLSVHASVPKCDTGTADKGAANKFKTRIICIVWIFPIHAWCLHGRNRTCCTHRLQVIIVHNCNMYIGTW